MTTFLIILAVLYAVGVVVTALLGLGDWSHARDAARSTSFHKLREQYLDDARRGAQLFTSALWWPLLTFDQLAQAIHDSKTPRNPEDREQGEADPILLLILLGGLGLVIICTAAGALALAATGGGR